MTQPGTFTPYSTVKPLLGTLPGWVPPLDKERIASYQKYEEIYWSSESGFDNIMRGDNDSPVMIPTARTLVNTLNRYTAPGFTFRVEPPEPTTDAPDAPPTLTPAMKITQLAFTKLFRREQFVSRFNSNKLMGGVRGDWLWHIVADPDKPVGKRLSIRAVDPASYFPVYDVDDPEKIVKVHLAEQVSRNGEAHVSRLTYTKVLDEAGNTTAIMRSHGVFKTENWWDLTKPEEVILPEEALPPEITSIPVYHVKTFDANAPFGSSHLRGLETSAADINQAGSDESLTLALDGVGVYATDGAAPVDENGDETDMILGPGRIISNANGLRRVTGTGSVSPYQDHINMLWDFMKMSTGASDVALGKVSSGEAESGVALAICFAPLLSFTGLLDQHIVDVHTQMFYDLVFWLTVYEELPLLNGSGAEAVPLVTVVPVIGPKLPVNATEVIQQVVDLRNCVPPVISLRTSHSLLRAAGLAIPEDEAAQLATEAAESLDPLGEPGGEEELADEARLEDEMGELV